MIRIYLKGLVCTRPKGRIRICPVKIRIGNTDDLVLRGGKLNPGFAQGARKGKGSKVKLMSFNWVCFNEKMQPCMLKCRERQKDIMFKADII